MGSSGEMFIPGSRPLSENLFIMVGRVIPFICFGIEGSMPILVFTQILTGCGSVINEICLHTNTYSIYKGIKKLVPGTILTITRDKPGHYPQPVPYWS